MVTLYLYEAKWNETEWREVFFVMLCFISSGLIACSSLGTKGLGGVEVSQGKGQRKRERRRPSQFFHTLKPSYLHPLFSFCKIIARLDIRSTSITSIYPLNTSTCHSAKKQQGAYTRVKWDRIYVQYNCQFSVSLFCAWFLNQPSERSMKLSKVGVRERQFLV